MEASRVSEDSFGVFFDEALKVSVPVRRFTLTNAAKMRVQLINYGATITTIQAPDKFGHLADVTLGFDDMDGIY